jgi:hypothetical protein
MPLTYEKSAMAEGVDLFNVLAFGRLWYAEGEHECNRLREGLGRNRDGKKHAVRT